ncbi:MPP10 (YJR002W) [Zygosaccharomyces parabailii]|nr:MPP10 (YJR002W) [Zygosaccharomyces parabailii]CDH14741.1 related to U3 small nucleolar RNA-associated protein MPP10 [Zygosaccharomyces bailii ISA1307]
MSGFSEVLKSEPISAFSKEPSQALDLVKIYLDEVLALYKKSGTNVRTELDEIVTDGLDANQVWWQAKMVVDNVGSDLLKKIQNLKEITNEDYDSNSSAEENPLESNSLESASSENDDEEPEHISSAEQGHMDAGSKLDKLATYDADSRSDEAQGDNIGSEQLDDKSGSSQEKSTQMVLPEKFDDNTQPGEDGSSHFEKEGLNDGFFDLDEFNRQTMEIEAGKHANEDNEEDIDYFADVPSDDDEDALYYEDFFDQPKSQTSAIKSGEKLHDKTELTEKDYDAALDSAKLDLFADEDNEQEQDDENENAANKLSTFERQQLEIKKQIDQLEAEAIADKKWALTGEVQSKDRPQDALLEEEIEFDRTSKPVPVITKEVSESLEEMIRRRIQDANFDDLQRRVVTDTNLKKYKPDFRLSDQKSSKSLAELYEDDYKGVSQDTAVSEELEKEHNEISEMFSNLFYKLDTLSSAHFIPKPPKKSLEVRVNAPAVSMEEAQPLTLSTEQSLAPQEVYTVRKGGTASEIRLKNGMAAARDELTREDKQRLRRAMKRKRASGGTAGQGNERKKTKKDAAVSALSNAKNITVINRRGEKHDVRGNVKDTKVNESINRIKL